MLAPPNIQYPKQINVRIKKDPKIKGISGFASNTNNLIGFASHVWPNEKHRRWIIIHELVNLLSSYYGYGGFPSDWWSNGRSPFPEYVSCLIMQKLGAPEDATWRRNVHKHKKDHQLYWKLHERYGVKLFQDFFTLLRRDKIDLRSIGKPWPHPDKTRSLYAIAYLSLAAKTNLTDLFKRYDIGKRPADWHKRHPEIPFKAYQITKKEVEKMIKKN